MNDELSRAIGRAEACLRSQNKEGCLLAIIAALRTLNENQLSPPLPQSPPCEYSNTPKRPPPPKPLTLDDLYQQVVLVWVSTSGNGIKLPLSLEPDNPLIIGDFEIRRSKP